MEARVVSREAESAAVGPCVRVVSVELGRRAGFAFAVERVRVQD